MISGWLGQNSTSGSGVLTVTGWNLSGTPTNVIVNPATLQKVLLAGNDAQLQAIINLTLLQGALANTLVLLSQQDLFLGDAAGSQMQFDGLGDVEIDAASVFISADLIELEDAGFNLWFQIDAALGQVQLGDLAGVFNGSYIQVDSVMNRIINQLTDVSTDLENATKTLSLNGVGAAYAVNGNPGLTVNQVVVVDAIGTTKTLQFTGGILTGIV